VFLCETIKKETNIQTGSRPQDTQKNIRAKLQRLVTSNSPEKKIEKKVDPFLHTSIEPNPNPPKKCVHLANLLFMPHLRVDSLYMQIP